MSNIVQHLSPLKNQVQLMWLNNDTTNYIDILLSNFDKNPLPAENNFNY